MQVRVPIEHLRNRNLYPHYRIYCCLHISKKKKRRKGRRRGRKK
jgi:hypothetical protein